MPSGGGGGSGHPLTREQAALVSKFTDNTDFHGFKHVTDKSSNVCHRIIWATFVLICISGLGYYTYSRISSYKNYPYTTKLTRDRVQRISYPAFTLCNTNKVRYDRPSREEIWSQRNNKIFKGRMFTVRKRKPKLRLNDVYRDHYSAEWIAWFEETDWGGNYRQSDPNLPQMIQTNGHQLLDTVLDCSIHSQEVDEVKGEANLEDDNIEDAGDDTEEDDNTTTTAAATTMEETTVSSAAAARPGGKINCIDPPGAAEVWWDPHYDPLWGNCFTFNSDESLSTGSTHRENGLTFVLSAQYDKYIDFRKKVNGIRLLGEFGKITLIGKQFVTVSLKLTYNTYLPPPWNEQECLAPESYKLDYFPFYTKTRCRKECEAKQCDKILGCKLKTHPGPVNNCNETQQVNCSAEITQLKISEFATCNCIDELTERPCVEYVIDYDIVQYPLSDIAVDRLIGQLPERPNGTDPIDRSSMIVLKYVMDELAIERLEQVPADDVLLILGDLGGTMGLCMGASILSIIHLVEFVIIFLCCTRCGRHDSSNPHPQPDHTHNEMARQNMTSNARLTSRGQQGHPHPAPHQHEKKEKNGEDYARKYTGMLTEKGLYY